MQTWLVSVLGATMVAWGAMMLFLILFPLQRKEKWSWNALMVSVVLWFCIDTFISSYHHSLINVVVNTIFFLQFIAPLLVLKENIESNK